MQRFEASPMNPVGAQNLKRFFASANLHDIQRILEAAAGELCARGVTRTRDLYEFARRVEAHRVGQRIAREVSDMQARGAGPTEWIMPGGA